MKKNKHFIVLIGLLIVLGFAAAGCATEGNATREPDKVSWR